MTACYVNLQCFTQSDTETIAIENCMLS